MLNKVVFDLETQKSFDDVGGRNRNHLLRVSLAAAYSYLEDKFLVYDEKQIHRLGELLQEADLVIGYNILSFDYEVLRPYLKFSLPALPTLDMLVEVEKVIGHRVSLDSLAEATLGVKKTGSGMQALHFWKTRQLDKLRDYCVADVRITRDLYDYAVLNKKLGYKDFFTKKEFPILFPEPAPRPDKQKQISLF
ncbi:MAG: ribonuclease H-like domain-containing protein [Candidatus Doudnabacteria bacterium]|nr:ribonuclease H-like domain-containing protein [Candidatus Doudnabacteria bacterium]